MLILRQILDEPISGFWDGGKKQVFDWHIDGIPRFDSKGGYVKVGSWAANLWFHVAVGKTEKATLGNCRRRLSLCIRKSNHTCEFEYIES